MSAFIREFLHELGGLALFLRDVLRALRSTHGNWDPVVAQVVSVSYRSLPTVAFSGAFVGAILVIQFSLILKQYDALIFLGGLNTSAVVREAGPLIISFLLAGKIGAYTAAELGTMRVTEQIDAIQCLGTNPIQYLIVPRFLGIVVSSVLLLLIGLLVSITGAMLVSSILYGMNPLQFVSSIPRFSSPSTLASGMLKALVFGVVVAGVSCFKGYTASGGARGVGKAVTQAAVYTNLYIILADYGTSTFLDLAFAWMGQLWGTDT
jgi:phospholipid/cholesterol/gamma-HCH transport system permease protein